MASRLLGSEYADIYTIFGPTNVAIYSVQIAAELGNGHDAVRRGIQVDVEHLPPGLRGGWALSGRGKPVTKSGKPVLYVIACGGRPAGDLPAHMPALLDQGWDVCVLATPSALKFMDTARLSELTGHVVRSDYKQPDEPDVLPTADAIAVAPATFNTINKWAHGSSDTLALGIPNEAIGRGLPIVAVPVPNVALAKHPAFQESVGRLRSWGVRLIFDPERYPLPTPNMGPPAAELFPWAALKEEISKVKPE